MQGKRSPEAWVSIAGFAAAVIAMVGMFYGGALFCRNPVVIGVQVAAALLMLWARLTFGLRSFHAAADPTAGGLVDSGPYRFWRHPIYAAILYFVWAGALCHRTALAWAGAAVVTLGLALRMRMEERLLRAQMPGYAAYMARTKRVVPFVL